MSSVITFIVPGQEQASRSGTAASLPAGFSEGLLKHSVQVGTRRASGAEIAVNAVSGRDTVVIELANGPTLFLTPESARDLFLAQGNNPTGTTVERGGALLPETPPSQVFVSPQLRWQGLEQEAIERGGADRGFLGSVFIKLIQVFERLGGDKVADLTTEAAVALVDSQVDPGVYPLQASALPRLKERGGKIASIPPTVDGKALLVFLHGTFSNTQGSFGKLWSEHPTSVAALFRAYDDQVYALEHATLGEGPIANALALAQALPQGARVHLLSHSRGGLVGEILARACGDAEAAASALLDPLWAADDAQRAQLEQLVKLAQGKRLVVERFVRVACPARGTLLASRRLDAYLSVFKWGLELARIPLLPQLLTFLAAVAQRRTDPQMIPGLEAQMPESALVRWLNQVREPIPGTLRVIAGDLQGDSIGSWIKTLLADAYYWTDNDLVVHTSSMYGGTPRRDAAAFLLDRGGQVTHFNYFSNARTAEAVVNGLLQDAPQGYRPIGPLSWEGKSTSGDRGALVTRAGSERPAVIVLPGILGSNLKVNGERVWVGLRLVNGLDELAYGKPGVAPDGPVERSYQELMDYLSSSHDVIAFGYDWRQPMEVEARRLAATVERELELRRENGRPVRLLAHSMGGLLARVMQLEAPDTWKRMMANPESCLLMLGTPNQGSWAPMQVLSGDDRFGNGLAYVGAPFSVGKARQIMAEMPGFLQLQANLLAPRDPLELVQTWQLLADQDLARLKARSWWHNLTSQLSVYQWGIPSVAVLQAAAQLRRRLDGQDLGAYARQILLVVGQADFTPAGYRFGTEGLTYITAPEGGDGRVTLLNACLPGVQTWTLDCVHGDLAADKRAFGAYLDLLQRRSTEALPRLGSHSDAARGGALASGQVEWLERGRRSAFDAIAAPPQSIEELFALPSDQPPQRTQGKAPLAVVVLNSQLQFVRQPLIVGHYIANLLTGAEREADGLIGGMLSDSLKLGRYPTQPGSQQVFLDIRSGSGVSGQMPRPEGVIVVGLGEEGKLKADELVASVRQGVIAWAQRLMETNQAVPVNFELAATLLGSGGMGISAAKSAALVAQAVLEANRRLEERGWCRVSRLILVELYLDRATEAWRAVRGLLEARPQDYQLDAQVHGGLGALRRPLDWGYRSTSFDFISAVGQFDEYHQPIITYSLDTRRARAEIHAQAMQGRLLQELVSAASNAPADDTSISRTLFRLLVPVEMEPFLSGSSEMQIELDNTTAAIPWELLDADSEISTGERRPPWAIRAKLLRRLRTADFRSQVVDASRDERILVIGEPAAGAGYARLAGARAEARAVASSLAASLGDERVEKLISDDDERLPGVSAQQVVSALFRRDWRIIHIAGHGAPPEYDEVDNASPGALPGKIRDPRGVVLSGGIYLGPREINGMRVVPELVFINCCHLAAYPPDNVARPPAYNRALFASTVAEQLIRIGVRCVIAAGWAVDDAAASLFASTFYTGLLNGERFLDAVAIARLATWTRYPGNNTWAAYQCYGDPDWRLRSSDDDVTFKVRTAAEQFDGVASSTALQLALEGLAQDCRYKGGDRAAQRERLDYLEQAFGMRWGKQGNIAEAFGWAWAQWGDLDKALAHYEQAVAARDGSASLDACQRLEELKALRRWRELERVGALGNPQGLPGPAKRQALGLLDAVHKEWQQGLERQELLADNRRRAEPLQRCATFCQRLAMLDYLRQGKGAANDSIRQARQFAQSCSALLQDNPDEAWAAAVLQELAAELAQGRGGQGWLKRSQERREQLRGALTRILRERPGFAGVACLLLLDLYEILAANALADSLTLLEERLEELYQRVPGSLDWALLLEQVCFAMLAHGGSAGPERTAAAGLVQLITARVQSPG